MYVFMYFFLTNHADYLGRLRNGCMFYTHKICAVYWYRYLKVKVEVQQFELGIIGKLIKWCKQ